MSETDKHRDTDNAIVVRGLNVHYGKYHVLKDIDMDVPRGMTTVVLGGSGSGKTTLLRHLIRLERPHSGTIQINGSEITGMKERELDAIRRKTGIAFQGAALLSSITVADNIALPLREHTRLEESTIGIMVRMKLDLVGLAGFGHMYPEQLSGGMKKRAGIARAIAMDPQILFFDEPSAGLDPVTAAGIDALILKLKKVFSMTIVVVTHELASLFEIADRVIMLERGEAIFAGTLEELRASEHPRIKMFLERRADDTTPHPEDYLNQIAGD